MDVIHSHDGHTVLTPILCSYFGWRDYFRNTGMVVTIHNSGKGYHQEMEDLVFYRGYLRLTLEAVRKCPSSPTLRYFENIMLVISCI